MNRPTDYIGEWPPGDIDDDGYYDADYDPADPEWDEDEERTDGD